MNFIKRWLCDHDPVWAYTASGDMKNYMKNGYEIHYCSKCGAYMELKERREG